MRISIKADVADENEDYNLGLQRATIKDINRNHRQSYKGGMEFSDFKKEFFPRDNKDAILIQK
jgi:hypothetical protein